jgi:hypothetical protein
MTHKQEIKKVRLEIDSLNREKRAIQEQITLKKERLDELLIITDNQISMNETDGFQE